MELRKIRFDCSYCVGIILMNVWTIIREYSDIVWYSIITLEHPHVDNALKLGSSITIRIFLNLVFVVSFFNIHNMKC